MLASLVLASVLVAAPAPVASAAEDVPLAVQVSRELFTPETWNQYRDSVVPELARQLREKVAKLGGTVDDGLDDAMRALWDEVTPYSRYVEIQASVLAKNFSEAELVEIRDFYRTPLGRKFLKRFSALMQDTRALVQDDVRSSFQRFPQRLGPHIHMPERPAAGPAPAKAPDAKPAANPR